MFQPGDEIAVEEAARDGRAGDFKGAAGRGGAVGESCARRAAAQAPDAAAGLAGFPLNLGVVEHDVKVARAGVRAVDEHELELVEFVYSPAVVADAVPVDAEG